MLILKGDFLLSADIFQNQLFQKILSGTPSECQTAWIQVEPKITWSGSKMFAKINSRWRNWPLAGRVNILIGWNVVMLWQTMQTQIRLLLLEQWSGYKLFSYKSRSSLILVHTVCSYICLSIKRWMWYSNYIMYVRTWVSLSIFI